MLSTEQKEKLGVLYALHLIKLDDGTKAMGFDLLLAQAEAAEDFGAFVGAKVKEFTGQELTE